MSKIIIFSNFQPLHTICYCLEYFILYFRKKWSIDKFIYGSDKKRENGCVVPSLPICWNIIKCCNIGQVRKFSRAYRTFCIEVRFYKKYYLLMIFIICYLLFLCKNVNGTFSGKDNFRNSATFSDYHCSALSILK